ncbi:transposase [Bifidobacterium pseudocatenulatum]|uniref:transposase n=1 Tax=Bifidobacterium pseudocatenulatum TaxID=28026 RepID=UPI0022E38CDC|nr:transposase [Bifidobacterium pseudocatenulatum]
MTWDWRPMMAGPKHPRHYDGAFKRQIVQSCESGKPSREIGAEYDIARSTLRRWVQDIRDRRLEMETDVSEQAAPVFTRRQA